MEMARQRVIVDDEVIESGEIQEMIQPLWWSVSIYDGEEQYRRDLEGFTAPQRYLFALQWYLAEVNNGGHDQFYSNSTGIVWEDAMNGAREMGMEELYGIIRESADRMGGEPAKEREDRWDQMSEREPDFGDLNKRLYAMEDIEQRMAAYALENRQALYFDGEVEMPVLRTDREETSEKRPGCGGNGQPGRFWQERIFKRASVCGQDFVQVQGAAAVLKDEAGDADAAVFADRLVQWIGFTHG